MMRARVAAVAALGLFAAVLVIVVVFLFRNAGMLLLGLVGLMLVTLGGWWIVTGTRTRRIIGGIAAVVGAMVIGIAIARVVHDVDRLVLRLVVLAVLLAPAAFAQQPNPRQQPGAPVTVYAPDQHDLYDGLFTLSAGRIHMVGGVNDPPGWDHMDNAAATVKPVGGTVEVNVNEIANTGTFEARLKIPEGDLVVAIDRFNEFAPCQNGGIVAYLHEHGSDSGCGDDNWPKTFVFLAGWGFGHATLNGKPLYQDYEMHFMVTQGIRDRNTLRVNYPMANKRSPAGEVNPATQQIDFYIRSPQQNPKNIPAREVFMHFFGMEITWK